MDACPVTYFPGPMMVNTNVKNVLRGRSLSVCCVADVLTVAVDDAYELHKHISLLKL